MYFMGTMAVIWIYNSRHTLQDLENENTAVMHYGDEYVTTLSSVINLAEWLEFI